MWLIEEVRAKLSATLEAQYGSRPPAWSTVTAGVVVEEVAR
jgi:hypothetical protein